MKIEANKIFRKDINLSEFLKKDIIELPVSLAQLLQEGFAVEHDCLFYKERLHL